MLYASIRPTVYKQYESGSNVGGFDLPMDKLSPIDGYLSMSHEAMIAHLQANHRQYWHGRIYKSYSGKLDFYVQFSSDANVYYYQLVMPAMPEPAAEAIGDGTLTAIAEGDASIEGAPPIASCNVVAAIAPNMQAYPQPADWWLATGKRLILRYTMEEYLSVMHGISLTSSSTRSMSCPR